MQSTSPFYPHCVQAFKQSALFSGMDESQLAQTLVNFRRETWKKRSRVGLNLSERFVVVTRGRIEMVRTDYSTGRELTIFLLRPGDAFDLVTLLDGEPHDIIPIALDQVDLLSVPLDSVREWLRTHPLFNQKLLPYLGRQMRALEELAADLAFHDTVTRLARLITHHLLPNQQSLATTFHPIQLVNDLTHETLARMIGSVRVVVSRHIQLWKQNGTVSTARKQLVIRDLKGLENTCHKIERSFQKKK